MEGDNHMRLSRRHLLRSTLVAAGSLIVAPSLGLASIPSHRKLAFNNLHTGEKLSITYAENGQYIPGALTEINHILRDFRTGDIKAIDPRLLDTVHDLHQIMESNQPFGIISGYRSPATNQALHDHSNNVAVKSQHLLGKAIDLVLPGHDTTQLCRAAKSLRRGGVGYYPEFVHVDTGPVRYW